VTQYAKGTLLLFARAAYKTTNRCAITFPSRNLNPMPILDPDPNTNPNANTTTTIRFFLPTSTAILDSIADIQFLSV